MRWRAKHTILITGANGVVGAAAVQHYASLPDWQVLALSRRPVRLPDGERHVPLDLTEARGRNSGAHRRLPRPAAADAWLERMQARGLLPR